MTFSVGAQAKHLAMTAVVMGTALHATAATADKFGALAVDRSNGFVYGFAYDHPSRAEAEKRAMDEGIKRGGKPAIVLSWSGPGCGAYRTIDPKDGNAYGWGLAETREMADAIARTEVAKRSKGAPANQFVWGCNSKTDTPQKVFKNEPVGKPGGALVFSHPAYLSALAFSPDGKTIASSARGTGVMLWSLRTGSLERTLPGLGSNATSLLFSADGSRLIGSDGNKLAFWNTRSGAILAQQEPKALLKDFAFSKDGSKLYAIGAQESYEGPVQGWVKWTLNSKDGSTEQKVTLNEAGTHGYYSADYAPAGDFVVTGGDKPGKTLRFWDAATGKPLREMAYNLPRSVRYSPDGSTIAIGINDGALLLDPATGKDLRKFGSGVVYDAKFSPDGKSLATAHRDGTVRVWDVATGEKKFEAAGHKNLASILAYSGDGKLLASGSEDGDVRVWNAMTGEPAAVAAGKK